MLRLLSRLGRRILGQMDSGSSSGRIVGRRIYLGRGRHMKNRPSDYKSDWSPQFNQAPYLAQET